MVDFLKYFDGTDKVPREVQTQALEWVADKIKNNKLLAIRGPVGCHAKDTPILMYDGRIKNVQDIMVGEELMGPDSQPRKVVELHRGEEEMFKITPVKGDSFTVNRGHTQPFIRTKLRSGNTKRKNIPKTSLEEQLQTYTINDYLELPPSRVKNLKLFRTGIEMSGRELPMPPYVLGIWLGDGTSVKTQVTSMDKEVIDSWASYGESIGCSLKVYEKKGQVNKAKDYTLKTASGKPNPALDLLREIEVLNNKHIPHIYKTSSRYQRLQLLAGLIDTDGYTDGGKTFEIATKYIALRNDILYVARSLGLAAYSKDKIVKGRTYYRIHISGHIDEIPVKVERRKCEPRKQKKNVLRTGVKAVESLGVGNYYGFSVEGPDKMYLMGDFTVTHNSGKSAVARAIQYVTQCPIVTPSNLLIDQYCEGYPNVNSLKGKSHYNCEDGLSCEDRTEVLEEKPCEGCPYVCSKELAMTGDPTFYNPMSLFYATKREEWTPPRVIVVDEAHQLASMILMMSGKKFEKVRYDFDDRCTNITYLKGWLKSQAGKLFKLEDLYKKKGNHKEAVKIGRDRRNINYTIQGLEDDPKNYAIWIEKTKSRGRPTQYLHVKPVKPPKFITNQILNADRIILMSGTLFKHDIEELVPDRDYTVIDLPSPIPKERRPIIYSPVPFKMNWKTEPKKIAEEIHNVIEKNPGQNTIIHVSYALSEKLAPFFPGAICNDAANKSEKLEQFKKEGGVFLAAGCAEGIDLKGELCRLNIVPKLLYPNLNDPVVKKRMELSDGQDWYNIETMKVLIQQAGRSTRSESDFSKTYILDPGFLWRLKKYKDVLPRSFVEALVVEK